LTVVRDGDALGGDIAASSWPTLTTRNALASASDDASQPQNRHLRPIDERKGAKFAALDHNVAHVLGPERGAAVLYGFLASTWFEYADPEKLRERNLDRKKKITPGDWVEVRYRQFMDIAGTRAKASITRWLDVLTEDLHPCPWSRCAEEHPLVVVKRQGRTKPNRYRKWQCGEDVPVVRRRVQSQKLREVAQRRVQSGQRLNGIFESAPANLVETVISDAQLPLLAPSNLEALPVGFKELEPIAGEALSVGFTNEPPEALPVDFTTAATEALPEGFIKPSDKASHEAYSVGLQKPSHKASLRGNSVVIVSEYTTAIDSGAAAIEQADEIDAVACEVVDAILELAARVESDYPDERASDVARRLAGSALGAIKGGPAFARAALIRAIGDRRLARARNPVGLLLRGVVGDENGHDRFLLAGAANGPTARVDSALAPETPTALPPGLHEALLDRIRRDDLSPTWLRESEIPAAAVTIARAAVKAETKSPTSSTPLVDKLAAIDPDRYVGRLDAILANLELPVAVRGDRGLDHPMVLGMCRSRLEIELSTEDGRRR
jgi:hypothetical protein